MLTERLGFGGELTESRAACRGESVGELVATTGEVGASSDRWQKSPPPVVVGFDVRLSLAGPVAAEVVAGCWAVLDADVLGCSETGAVVGRGAEDCTAATVALAGGEVMAPRVWLPHRVRARRQGLREPRRELPSLVAAGLASPRIPGNRQPSQIATGEVEVSRSEPSNSGLQQTWRSLTLAPRS